MYKIEVDNTGNTQTAEIDFTGDVGTVVKQLDHDFGGPKLSLKKRTMLKIAETMGFMKNQTRIYSGKGVYISVDKISNNQLNIHCTLKKQDSQDGSLYENSTLPIIDRVISVCTKYKQ